MLCIVVEKIDESASGSYRWSNGYRCDMGNILCFKAPQGSDDLDICRFMYNNKNKFTSVNGCYVSIDNLIHDSTSPEDLLDKIEASRIDGDSEALVQFFWCNTDNVPDIRSDYLLRLEYCEDAHTYVRVIHTDEYDEEEEREDEWEYDEGVYIRKLDPDYVFEL